MAHIYFDTEGLEETDGRVNLIARKKRGKIAVSELSEALSRSYQTQGFWVVVIKATEEDGYQGMSADIPQGDAVELYKIEDWLDCPVCAATFSGIEFCPHCTERIKRL